MNTVAWGPAEITGLVSDDNSYWELPVRAAAKFMHDPFVPTVSYLLQLEHNAIAMRAAASGRSAQIPFSIRYHWTRWNFAILTAGEAVELQSLSSRLSLGESSKTIPKSDRRLMLYRTSYQKWSAVSPQFAPPFPLVKLCRTVSVWQRGGNAVVHIAAKIE